MIKAFTPSKGGNSTLVHFLEMELNCYFMRKWCGFEQIGIFVSKYCRANDFNPSFDPSCIRFWRNCGKILSTGGYRGGFSGGPPKPIKIRKFRNFAVTFDRVELLSWNFYWKCSMVGQNFRHKKFRKNFRNISKIRNRKF
jgi:hypothetical protein